MAGTIVCAFLAVLFLPLVGVDFNGRWRRLRDGMTQKEVKQALGSPTSIGTSGTTGAGGQMVTHWEYRRRLPGRYVYYCVDFDYIGPGGAPLVFRTERYSERWELPGWELPDWWSNLRH